MKLQRFSIPVLLLLLTLLPGCGPGPEKETVPFLWENANVYFLLTDRFANGDPTNDVNFNRTGETAAMRGFLGGDLAGVIEKMEEGYFDQLGVSALWLTPWFEQIHGSTDEGTGETYGYHGYWTRDWTALDPNFGSPGELARLVETAHSRGIRIVMDVIINHTGPVTERDPVWPSEWVRTSPACTYEDYESTVTCTLVENLPDIRTESEAPVELPPALLKKWEQEGRLDKELEELDRFFQQTGYPRAPRYYLIKWLTDYVRRYGIDAYRLDTAKHIEEGIWQELFTEAARAFRQWKEDHPEAVLDTTGFFMVGEVYGYGISAGRWFDFGDRKVDFFAQSIHSLINFDFKYDATGGYEELFSGYSRSLSEELSGNGVLNYLTSHDDGSPFDRERKKPLEAGTKLLLTPGACQIYYGDESGRNLVIPGAVGDATLRGPMNWEEIETDAVRNGFRVRSVLEHYRKLGQFRKAHPAVGAGSHRLIRQEPYLFRRDLQSGDFTDRVVVGLDWDPGIKRVPVKGVFPNGTALRDYYSGLEVTVRSGEAVIDSPYGIILLGAG